MSDCSSCIYFMECRNDPNFCHSWTPNEEWCKKQGEKRKSASDAKGDE